jgi:hypothetical protein
VNKFAKLNDISEPDHKTEYRRLHKEYKRLIQRKKRLFQKDNRNNLANMLGKDQARCWQLWTRLKTKPAVTNTPSLETFHNYFSNQMSPPLCEHFDKEHVDAIDIAALTNSTVNLVNDSDLHINICDSVITEEEVVFHLRKLKNNKASGVDGIPAEFYKYAAKQLVSPFCSAFNYIFEQGEYPSQWSEGIINALHKKGDHSNPDNYRKITITVAMGKIFDSILNARLYHKNEALQLDDPCQFGFTPSARTSDCFHLGYYN